MTNNELFERLYKLSKDTIQTPKSAIIKRLRRIVNKYSALLSYYENKAHECGACGDLDECFKYRAQYNTLKDILSEVRGIVTLDELSNGNLSSIICETKQDEK